MATRGTSVRLASTILLAICAVLVFGLLVNDWEIEPPRRDSPTADDSVAQPKASDVTRRPLSDSDPALLRERFRIVDVDLEPIAEAWFRYEDIETLIEVPSEGAPLPDPGARFLAGAPGYLITEPLVASSIESGHIVLERGLALEVLVEDVDGDPIADADVCLSSLGPPVLADDSFDYTSIPRRSRDAFMQFARTDRDGRARLQGLSFREGCFVRAAKPGYAPAPLARRLKADHRVITLKMVELFAAILQVDGDEILAIERIRSDFPARELNDEGGRVLSRATLGVAHRFKEGHPNIDWIEVGLRPDRQPPTLGLRVDCRLSGSHELEIPISSLTSPSPLVFTPEPRVPEGYGQVSIDVFNPDGTVARLEPKTLWLSGPTSRPEPRDWALYPGEIHNLPAGNYLVRTSSTFATSCLEDGAAIRVVSGELRSEQIRLLRAFCVLRVIPQMPDGSVLTNFQFNLVTGSGRMTGAVYGQPSVDFILPMDEFATIRVFVPIHGESRTTKVTGESLEVVPVIIGR